MPEPAPPSPDIPPHTRAIDVTDTRALAAIGCPERCGVFEVLRCFHRPATLSELCTATGLPRARLAAIIDGLVDAGLARTVQARGARRHPSYETTCQQVMVLFDTRNAEESAAVRRHLEATTGDLRAAAAETRGTTAADAQGAVFYDSRGKFLLRPDQYRELRMRLHAVDEFINQIAADCKVGDPVGPVLCNHLIEMRVVPLRTPLLPMPWIMAADRRTAPELAKAAHQSSIPALAPREQAVAIALAHGESRPAIARRLGISANTVASTAKRVYAKLGVRSRAELANRIGALSRM